MRLIQIAAEREHSEVEGVKSATLSETITMSEEEYRHMYDFIANHSYPTGFF